MMMWRTLLLLTATSVPVMVSAQQLKPVSVDGTQTPGGVLIYKGKSYVSLDALRQAGATYNSKGLFIYAQPTPGGPPLKLSGCLNQKLYNNAYYFTVPSPAHLEAGDPGQGGTWKLPFVIQPVTDLRFEIDSEATNTAVDLQDALVVFKDGTQFTQRSLPISVMRSGLGISYYPAKRISQGTLSFKRGEGEVESNPPVKVVLPQANIPFTGKFPGMTIDLTCTK